MAITLIYPHKSGNIRVILSTVGICQIYITEIFVLVIPGGLFEPENEGQALAFKYAIEKLNVNNNILPQTLVIYDVQEVLTHDSFHASKKGKHPEVVNGWSLKETYVSRGPHQIVCRPCQLESAFGCQG